MQISISSICIFALAILELTPKVESRTERVRSGCDAVDIVGRGEWNARPMVRDWSMVTPVNHVIIEHTVTRFRKTKISCIRDVRFIQDMHLDERGWWDIAYSFLVCGDGRVYEGRGWNRTGSHAINYNTRSIGVAFMGNFNKDTPTKAMLDATVNLIDCGVQLGFVTPSRDIHGHRDVTCTEAPGQKLYDIIRYWKGFKGGRMPDYYCPSEKLPDPVLGKHIINDG